MNEDVHLPGQQSHDGCGANSVEGQEIAHVSETLAS
jgi:hypothetical protein